MSMSGDQRLYWLHRPETIDEDGEGLAEETIGPLTESQVINLFRRKDHDGYTGDSFYRRDGMEGWHSLRAFAQCEFGDPEQLANMQRVGIEYIEWLSARHDDECPACKALEGKVFPINEPPPMPPVDCRCELWCKCILVAAADPEMTDGRSLTFQ